jgi:antitoxin (DNA-binding transcriptional repressor) of toxin-antitoxin stability system
MPKTVSIDEAERNLRELLSSLTEGERITIVDEAGVPLGEVCTVSEKRPEEAPGEEFMDRWDELTRQIGEAWDGKRSAVEQLRKDRNRLAPDDYANSSADDT